MKKNGFTIIELIAVMVLLGIILAIAVPTITGVIKRSTKNAFESDAKLVLKGVDYRKLNDGNFDPTTINKNNIDDLLGISSSNYENVTITVEEGTPIISIIGTDKWAGFIACGTYHDMRVVENPSDCNVDSLPPVLTILGNNPLNMYIGEVYSDPGATAIDNISGNITNDIIVTGSINPYIPGTYTITYRVADIFENESVAMRTVNVIDNAYPMITFNPNGNSTYAQTRSTTITATDLGLLDNNSLKYLWSINTTEPNLDSFINTYTSGDSIPTPIGVTGSYYLWAQASDTVGNRTVLSSGVFNLDNEAPVIGINGDTIVTINKESTYTDAGTTATDNIDENVTVTSTGSINPSVVGTYTITYSATDLAGNAAISVTRTINVVDVQAPVITLNGSNPTNIYVGSTYTDAGATAVDDVDGNVTSRIIVTGAVNPSVAGTYIITYTVKDNANNTATLTRTVNVIDNIAPTVVFGTNGNTTWAKNRSTTVTVSDTHTGVNPSSLKYLWNTSTTQPSEVSFNTAFASGGTITSPAGVTGLYYLWVLAKDNVGNTTITRTNVFNLDNTSPVITLNGNSTVNIAINSSYSDAGATATDSSEGVITNRIVVTSTVNPSVGGTYTVTYNVNDAAGNAATTVTRTVIVRYCADGTLVNDPTYGYICSKIASSSSSCNSCTYSVSNYGSNCSACGSTCSITETASNIATTTYSCPSGYTASGSGSSMTCSKTATTSPSTTSGSAYCSEPTYSISGGSCVRTVSCSGCSGLGVDCMNAKCGAGGYSNASWSCGTSTCTATMAIRYSCSTGTNDSMYSSTCYYCPSGYTTSGSGSSTTCSKVVTTSNVATTSYSCPSGYTSSGSGSSMTCSKTTTTTSSSTCPGGYTTVSCNSCTYYTSTYGANCSSCGSTTSYYCPGGWYNYTGSGSSLTCYKGAN